MKKKIDLDKYFQLNEETLKNDDNFAKETNDMFVIDFAGTAFAVNSFAYEMIKYQCENNRKMLFTNFDNDKFNLVMAVTEMVAEG